ncbi:MAG: hypothetical protein IKB71_01925 [Lentisphaeria bacterium]|nr:hypothetical protein [Lentisphaeria bacterium]
MKKVLLFITCCIAAAVYGSDVIYYPEFEDSVSFYASFDAASPDADISEGREKPVNVVGKLKFADGIRGKALFCGKGGANVRYMRKDNFTFNRPGTLLFFIKGIDWKTTPGSRIFFTGFESGKGFFGLQIPGWPKQICPCSRELHVSFMYSKKFKNKTFFAQMPGGEAECGKWHMIAFSWAPGQLRVNMDNLPGKTYKVDFDLTDDAFPIQVFSVGYSSDRNFLLDEYTVYNRRLSDGELVEIFNKYMKNVK